jgi:NAD(P)-dependent dehydrogenase (short-subunit alcohol dehydrogenase family)
LSETDYIEDSAVEAGRSRCREKHPSAALFLASSESSYISGIELPVDGGMVSV